MTLDLSLVGKSAPPRTFSYSWRDTALYALGIGSKRAELDYLYEGRGPRVHPTFALVAASPAIEERLFALGIDFEQMVHHAQSLEVHAPLPPEATLTTSASVAAVYDLRKFAVVVVHASTQGPDGAPLADCDFTLIQRGAGNFGGSPPPKTTTPQAPRDRAPDFTIEERVSEEQALLYRLSGDRNPLHADPELAARIGFAQGPILHGLCTYGHALRALGKGLLSGDTTRVRRLDAQFKKPVWPGETLVTEGHDLGDGVVALSTRVKERDEVVLGSAWARVSGS